MTGIDTIYGDGIGTALVRDATTAPLAVHLRIACSGGEDSGPRRSTEWDVGTVTVTLGGNVVVATPPPDPDDHGGGTFTVAVSVGTSTGDLTGTVGLDGTKTVGDTWSEDPPPPTTTPWHESATFHLMVQRDDQAPHVEVRQLLPQAAPEAAQTLVLAATDSHGLRSATWEVPGHAAIGTQVGADGGFTVEFDWRRATGAIRSVVCPPDVVVRARVRNATVPDGNEAVLDVTVRDQVGPTATIASVQPDDVFPNDGTGASVPLAGRAEDHWSGVAGVQYALDGAVWTDVAIAPSPATTVDWTTSVRVAEFGRHQLQVRARDVAGNWGAPASVAFEIAMPVETGRQADPLSSTAYLADLLDFAGRSLTVPRNTASKLSAADQRRFTAVEIARVFHQGPAALTAAGDRVGAERVSAVRGAVEVFREVLDPTRRDLVAHWRFEEGDGPSTADVSGNGFAARAIAGAAPAWVGGPSGRRALRFDGQADELAVSSAGALTMTDALSIALWVRPEDQVTPDYAVILGKEGEYALGRSSDGVLGIALANTNPGWGWLRTNLQLPPDRWSHVAVVYDAGAVRVHVDGRLRYTYAGWGNLTSVSPLLQDVRIAGRQAFTARFKGAIADLRVYRGALPDATAHVLAADRTGPSARWPSSEETTEARPDEVTGRVLRLGTASWAQGHAGRALSLRPGQQARIDDVNGLDLGADDADFSVGLWLRVDDDTASSRRAVLRKADTPDAHTVDLSLAPGTSSLEVRVSAGTNPAEGPSPVPLTPGTWTHVAVVKALSALTLYLDGRPVARHALSGACRSNPGTITIGDSITDTGFTGLVEGLEFFDRALADEEVAWRAADADRAERAYLVAVYRSLLDLGGAGYDDLRLIRPVTAPAARAGFAARLGLRLRPGRPDELDELLRPAAALTEAWLEEVFGLRSTHRDPVGPLPRTPKIVEWRRQALRAAWAEQDASAARKREPVLDPWVLALDEAVEATGLRTVLHDRAEQLRKRAEALRGLRRAQPDSPTAFAALVQDAGLPLSRLDDLDGRRAQGQSIAADLAALNLQPIEFTRLLVARRLAAASATDESDWEDVERILVGVHRRGLLAGWKTEEATMAGGRAVLLAPETVVFRVRPPEDFPDRTLLSSRRSAEERLLARIEQDDTAATSNRDTVLQAEGAALEDLRDALLPAVAAALAVPGTVNAVSETLLVDVGATSGASAVSRAMLGVELVGGLLFALRSRRLEAVHPAAAWRVTDVAGFDVDWVWMSSYEAWRAAMLAFFYPEAMLFPTLRPTAGARARSQAFNALLDNLRRRDLSPTRRVAEALKAFTAMREKGVNGLPDTYTPSAADPAGHRALNDALGVDATTRVVVQEVLYFAPLAVAIQFWRWGAHADALDWFRLVYDDTAPRDSRLVYVGLRAERNDAPVLSRPDEWLRNLDPHTLASFHGGNPYTRFTVMALAQCLLDFADSEFTKATTDAVARARSLYLTVAELLDDAAVQQPAAAPARLLAENPLLTLLRLRNGNQLLKMRQGRNIAGMVRPSDEDLGAATGPVFTASGTPVLPGRTKLPATRYRYSVLVERARRIVALATQVEASYLAALERLDVETYKAIDAGQHLALAQQGVQLGQLRVGEAADSQQLAVRRQQRTQIQRSTYEDWLEGGPNGWERATLAAYVVGGHARISAISLQAGATIAGQAVGIAMASASSMGAAGAAAAIPMGVFSALTVAGAMASSIASGAETAASVASLQASWERREDQWQLEKNLADQDYLIGEQEKKLADDHQAIVTQELATATLQTEHAKAVADYLATKFLNRELYEWMSGVLGEVYAGLLQQATTLALVAQQQLGFERQVQAPTFVKDDYWAAPSEDGSGSAAPDRRGLTGSARLLQDLESLDQYAFDNDRRKLNLTQTFSLAAMVPVEFHAFRSTGVLPFNTPMRLFDEAFPGHYLRLVRQVRVSVVALVPPAQGIRATLATSGLSRVVVKNESFQTVTVRRDPEQVALTAPTAATGVFELDVQSDMLRPFEAMGVDGAWEFQLPRPANPLDYTSIADVLVSIDYTALGDPDLRRQVIQNAPSTVSAERAYSLRYDVPDAWYDLNNPEPGQRPRAVLTTLAGDFPPNLHEPRVQHVVLCLATSDDLAEGIEVDVDLALTPVGAGPGDGAVGGVARTARTASDGTISTRRTSGAAWISVQGQPAVGSWRLEFDRTLSPKLADGTVSDVLLVVTFAGRTPPWPQW